MTLVQSHHSHVAHWPLSSQIPQAHCSYLGVLGGDLQHKSQAVVVKVLIEGQQGPVHATLHQVVPILAQPDGLDPVNDLIIGPHQHICTTARAWFRATSHHTHGSEEVWGCPEALSLSPRMILGLSFPNQQQNQELKCHSSLPFTKFKAEITGRKQL